MQSIKDDLMYICVALIFFFLAVKLIFEPLEKLYYFIKYKTKYSKGIVYKDYYQRKEHKTYNALYTRKNILNQKEYTYYTLIKNECVSKNLLVLPKMKIEQFTTVIESSKPVDFVICDNEFNVIAGIELDINNKAEEIEKMFHVIQVPIFRIPENNESNQEQICNIITFIHNKYILKNIL